MKSDIEIAQSATMKPITEVAEKIGIKADDLELYGKYKAKLSDEYIDSVNNNCYTNKNVYHVFPSLSTNDNNSQYYYTEYYKSPSIICIIFYVHT